MKAHYILLEYYVIWNPQFGFVCITRKQSHEKSNEKKKRQTNAIQIH